jgi:hypothetical protein
MTIALKPPSSDIILSFNVIRRRRHHDSTVERAQRKTTSNFTAGKIQESTNPAAVDIANHPIPNWNGVSRRRMWRRMVMFTNFE